MSSTRSASGREPPPALLLSGLLARPGLRPEQVAMPEDRLHANGPQVHRAGALRVLVLTGKTTANVTAAADPAPDLVVPSLAEFGELLRAARGASSS